MTLHGSDPRVLVVEDEAIIALDLEQSLREHGYVCTGIATTADEALRLATHSAPDLVLMDIRIAGEHDGIYAASLLHERFQLPVVYLTAHADRATLKRAIEAAPYGYLVKPVQTSELIATLEVALRRRDLEAALRARERWFSATVASIADGVITSDTAGQVTYLNAAAEKVLGVSLDDANGRALGELVERSAADAPLPRRLQCADGQERWVTDTTRPVADGDTALGAVTVIHDVTETERLRGRAEEAHRLAALATMAAGVAHEVNNPLTVILGNLDELRNHLARQGNDPLAAELLEEITEAGSRVADIVADLRDFSAPALPGAAPRPADVARATHWAVRATAPHHTGRATVTVQLPRPLRVQIDEGRLGQVLVNLVANAAQAFLTADPQRNVIRITARRQGPLIAIDVRDNGPGMPAETCRRIFEPFFSTKEQGVGIGLAISHGLVAATGGELTVASLPGEGTTFTLTLPAAVPMQAAASMTPQRLLLIEDDPSVAAFLEQCLRGHEVVRVGDADEASRHLARDARFDALLVDLYLGDQRGDAFLEGLASTHPELAARAAVITGGPAAPIDHDRLERLGVPILTKPFDGAALQQLVEHLVDDRTA